MNRRLRKKRHRGEYTVFGFHVEFTTKERLAWESADGTLDGPAIVFTERLDEWAHAHGWCCAPGGDGKRWGAFVTPDQDRESAPYPGITAQGRVEILAYLQSLPEVDKLVASPLVDAWADNAKEWQTHCRIADEVLGPRDAEHAAAEGKEGSGGR